MLGFAPISALGISELPLVVVAPQPIGEFRVIGGDPVRKKRKKHKELPLEVVARSLHVDNQEVLEVLSFIGLTLEIKVQQVEVLDEDEDILTLLL